MDNRKGRPARRRPQKSQSGSGWSLLLLGVAAILVTAGIWALVDSSGSASDEASDDASSQHDHNSTAESTVVAVSSEMAAAAGVEVAAPSVDLGRIALNTPVRHTFRLRNTGSQPVSLGKARIEVLEGC